MALKNLQTVGDIWILTADADPTVSGIDAPQGSLAQFGSELYIKNSVQGGSSTDWLAISTGAGGVAWEVGGNTLTGTGILGANSAHNVELYAHGASKIILGSSTITVNNDVIPGGVSLAIGASGNEFLNVWADSLQSTQPMTIGSTAASDVSLQYNSVNALVIGATQIDVSKELDMTSNKIVGVANGVNPNDAVNKSQLDSVAAGLDPKESVRVATLLDIGGTYVPGGGAGGTGNFTGVDLTNGSNIDLESGAITLQIGDRILIKNQSDAKQNGIYVVTTAGAAGVIERAADHDGSPANEVSGGNYTFVENGTVEGGTGYVLDFDGQVLLNTDLINWITFSATSTEFANKTLSNLTSPTAVNQSLLPSAGTESLGGSGAGDQWSDLHANDVRIYHAGTEAAVLGAQASQVDLNAVIEGDQLFMSTASSASATNSGTVTLESGSNSSTGGSGDIRLATGTTVSGQRGIINVEAFQMEVSDGNGTIKAVMLADTDVIYGASDNISAFTFFEGSYNLDNSGNGGPVQLSAGGVELSADLARTGGNTIVKSGGDDGSTAGAVSSGSLTLSTPDAYLGAGTPTGANSGNILIQTGALAGTGTRGTITLDAGTNDARLVNAPDGGVSLAIANVGYVQSYVSSNAWLLGGNTLAASQILGSTAGNFDIDIQRNGDSKILLEATQVSVKDGVFLVDNGSQKARIEAAPGEIIYGAPDGQTSDEVVFEGSYGSNASGGNALLQSGGVIAADTLGLIGGTLTVQTASAEVADLVTNAEVSSGLLTIQTGDGVVKGTGADASSGNVLIKTGVSVGSGTRGQVEINATRLQVSDGNGSGIKANILADSEVIYGASDNTSALTIFEGSYNLDNSGDGGAVQFVGGSVELSADLARTGGALTLKSGGEDGGFSTAGAVSSGNLTIETPDAFLGAGTQTGANSGNVLIKTGALAGTGTRGTIILDAAQNDSRLAVSPDGTVPLAIATVAWVNSVVGSGGWSLTGNAGTSPSTNYLGSSDAQEVSLRYNAGEIVRIKSDALGTADQSAASTNSSGLKIETGDAAGATSDSGDLTLRTGTATQNRGKIIFDSESVDPASNYDSANPTDLGASNFAYRQVFSNAYELVSSSSVRGSLLSTSGGPQLVPNNLNSTGGVQIGQAPISNRTSGDFGTASDVEIYGVSTDITAETSGGVLIQSGNQTSVTSGDSGDVTINTGDSSNGTRGGYIMSAESKVEKLGNTIAAPHVTEKTIVDQQDLLANGAFQNVLAVPLTDNMVTVVEVWCTGAKVSGGVASDKSVAYKRTLHIEKDAGVASIVLESSDFTSENVANADKSSYDIQFSINGSNNLDVDVKGKNTVTIDWTLSVKSVEMSTI